MIGDDESRGAGSWLLGVDELFAAINAEPGSASTCVAMRVFAALPDWEVLVDDLAASGTEAYGRVCAVVVEVRALSSHCRPCITCVACDMAPPSSVWPMTPSAVVRGQGPPAEPRRDSGAAPIE